jgi:hypothetical protein
MAWVNWIAQDGKQVNQSPPRNRPFLDWMEGLNPRPTGLWLSYDIPTYFMIRKFAQRPDLLDSIERIQIDDVYFADDMDEGPVTNTMVRFKEKQIPRTTLSELGAFLKSCKNLKELKMFHTNGDQHDGLFHLRFLEGLGLKDLTIVGMNMEVFLDEVAEAAETLPALERIEIMVGGGDEQFDPRMYPVHHMEQLVDVCGRQGIWIDFTGCNGLSKPHLELYWEDIVSKNPEKLKKLDLHSGPVGMHSLPIITCMIDQAPALKEINLEGARLTSTNNGRRWVQSPKPLCETPEGRAFFKACVNRANTQPSFILTLGGNSLSFADWDYLARETIHGYKKNMYWTMRYGHTDYDYDDERGNFWAEFIFDRFEDNYARRMTFLAIRFRDTVKKPVDNQCFLRIAQVVFEMEWNDYVSERTIGRYGAREYIEAAKA